MSTYFVLVSQKMGSKASSVVKVSTCCNCFLLRRKWPTLRNNWAVTQRSAPAWKGA
jgi:hypothetical protein